MYDLKKPKKTPITSGHTLRIGVGYCRLII